MADDFPDNLRYTESDEWVRAEGDEVLCGITAYASDQLGDVVYVQLPETGRTFGKGESFGEIESVKAVSDLYCPIAGEITGTNDDLDQNPGLVNEDPYGKGWLVRIRPQSSADVDSLLDAAAYRQNTEERG